MSYCKRDGDHASVFVTQEDLAKPDVVSALAEEDEFGVILPNGEINWDCPCLGGMPKGPCGQEFKDAFSCFHYSTAEEKGSDCLETFKRMQECFQEHPDLYKDYEDDEVGEEVGKEVVMSEESGLQNKDTFDTNISEESVSSSGSKQLINSSVS